MEIPGKGNLHNRWVSESNGCKETVCVGMQTIACRLAEAVIEFRNLIRYNGQRGQTTRTD